MPSRRTPQPDAPRPRVSTIRSAAANRTYLYVQDAPQAGTYLPPALILWAHDGSCTRVAAAMRMDASVRLLRGPDNPDRYCTVSDYEAGKLLQAILGGLDFSRRAFAPVAQQAA